MKKVSSPPPGALILLLERDGLMTPTSASSSRPIARPVADEGRLKEPGVPVFQVAGSKIRDHGSRV